MTVTLAGKKRELTTCPRCHGDGFRMREFCTHKTSETRVFKMECKCCKGRGYTRK